MLKKIRNIFKKVNIEDFHKIKLKIIEKTTGYTIRLNTTPPQNYATFFFFNSFIKYLHPYGYRHSFYIIITPKMLKTRPKKNAKRLHQPESTSLHELHIYKLFL